jgi:peptidoglycan/LPS O-acetylase OafA/YrhL
VISKSLAASERPSLSSFLLNFYRRRVIRLLPALITFLLICTVLSVLFIPKAWLSLPIEETATYAFFGLSNLYLVNSADGYFDVRAAFNPFVHTWSLAVEEQFYLLFPIVFFTWLKHGDRATLLGTTARTLLPALVLLSLFIASQETQRSPERAFYLLPSRFWELGIGALLYQFSAGRGFKFVDHPAFSNFLFASGVALLGTSFLIADEKQFPFPWAVVPVAGACLLILSVTGSTEHDDQRWDRVLVSKPLIYIGALSYSLYLWHWAVFALFRWTVGLVDYLAVILAVLLSFTLASLSYHFPETYFRTHTSLTKASSAKVIGAGLCAIAATFFWATSFFSYQDRYGLSVTTEWEHLRPIVAGRTLPATPEAIGRTVFVIGDSHAGFYYLMARSAAEAVGARAVIITNPGCPIARLVSARAQVNACRSYEESVLKQLREQSKPGDIAFLASLRVERYGDQWASFEKTARGTSAHRAEQTEALEQAERFIDALKPLGLKVLFDAPKPIFRSPPFRCSDWFNRRNPICRPGFEVSREELLLRRKPAMEALDRLQQARNILVWDPFPILCSESNCSAFDGENPVFFDGDHLSSYGNRLLVPSFTQRLREIWNVDARAAVADTESELSWKQSAVFDNQN